MFAGVLSVALRKESVDRNTQRRDFKALDLPVALRKESVDRNIQVKNTPKAREKVALRKESVDRNTSIDNLTQGVFKSLSARRAWIEIAQNLTSDANITVALRKESVDRNFGVCLHLLPFQRRSPQGERG